MIILRIALVISEVLLYASVLGMVGVAASFLVLIGIKIYDLFGPPHWRNHLPRAALPEASLPAILLQIPTFNEHEIAIGALQSAVALDWPRDRLHIQMLDDSTDESFEMVDAAVRELAQHGYLVEHRHRTDRAGFKAGALADGLAATDEPFIAMLDVDFRPPAHWLRDVVPVLMADPAAAFIQSRCEFSNYRTNVLTRVQGMMLDAHFMIEQAGRFRAGWLFQFNGTGGVWRRQAIEEAGGWSSDSLVEDLDLTVRVALAGWHGLFLPEPGIPGLVPERISHWRVQQRRWSTGFVEVARKLLSTIWHAPWSLTEKLAASLLIFVQAFYPCAATAVVALAICIVLRGGAIAPYFPVLWTVGLLAAAVALGMTLLPYIALRRGPVWRYVATMVLLPPAMIFISLSNAPSILKTMFGRRESFKRTPKSVKARQEAPARD